MIAFLAVFSADDFFGGIYLCGNFLSEIANVRHADRRLG
jgi:hypothetical protein